MIEKTQGTKDELLIRKLFNNYDKNNIFYLTQNNTNEMLHNFNLQADSNLNEAVHERIVKNQSGYIKLEQFKKFLFYEPYPF